MGIEKTTKLLIGAPVCRREWIIDTWAYHVLKAVANLESPTEIAFLFVGGEDDPTFAKIEAFCQEAKVRAYVDYVDEPRDVDKRDWNLVPDRYERMVFLRNRLLTRVREIAPDFFLSLDSDILLHPEALRNLLESSQQFDVVGGRCYMTAVRGERTAPSNMIFGPRVHQRSDSEGIIKVDVVMAIKLMTPVAYGFDYKYDPLGEDLGISRNWKEAGLQVGYDGRVCSKHIMHPKMLHDVDPRCGF